MLLRRTLTILAILAALLGASGCKLKKKKPPIPPQATAPTIKPAQPPSDNPGPPPPVSVEPSRPMPTPGESTTTAAVQKPAPKPKTHITRKTVPPPPPEPPKPVENAGKAPAQQGPLTASVTQGQALQQRVDTAQLISTTENTLRALTRQLSADEQAMVQHIRSFIKQSQTATTEGDVERAYNLAFKARQLSDELVKK